MTNLVPDTSDELAQKVNLFGEFDPDDHSTEDWVSDETLIAYHSQCYGLLTENLDSLIGRLATIDKENSESIPLASEKIDADEFVMEPVDLTEYLAAGLAFEYTITDAILSTPMVFSDTVINTSDAGNNITIAFSVTMENPNVPYPFTNVQLDLTILMQYIATGRYDAVAATFTLTYADLYRGPLDNINDRGANYLDPIVATVTVAEPITGNPSTRYTKTGSLWSLNVSSAADAYTLDNGSNGILNFDFNFTTTSELTKFVGGEVIDSNVTDVDLNGALVMPASQWVDFTKTQSPNIIASLNALYSEVDTPQDDLYIDYLMDKITAGNEVTLDALPNGENIDYDYVIAYVNSALTSRDTIAKASTKEALRVLTKQSLADGTFIASANYAFEVLGLDYLITTISLTAAQLNLINGELIAVGVTDFESAPGYYDWAKVPNVNTLDTCSQYATATFESILTFEEISDHRTVSWITNNFNSIELELNQTSSDLDKVI